MQTQSLDHSVAGGVLLLIGLWEPRPYTSAVRSIDVQVRSGIRTAPQQMEHNGSSLGHSGRMDDIVHSKDTYEIPILL
ncbi:hypothetical protein Pan54_04310 [Rubinisphaera italica]|uniref:Uncharacterized protein n=1 Tax=Rubinisphaera italica TaxID=2527969 RepID=A0A5C5XBD7_9PLAN|nr:hypothetical protein Pan54_04310 [Rubinisphaera italica]